MKHSRFNSVNWQALCVDEYAIEGTAITRLSINTKCLDAASHRAVPITIHDPTTHPDEAKLSGNNWKHRKSVAAMK